MTIKIEIPSDNKELAGAIGRALSEYAGGATTGRVSATIENTSNAPRGIEVNAEDLTAKAEDDSLGGINSEMEQQFQETVDGPQTNEQAAAGAQSTGGKVDEKGVPFIPAICGNATIPCYASGARKGQWKKLRGVSEQEYDQVYALALGQVANTGTAQQQADTNEQSAEEVFGGQQQQQNAANTGQQQQLQQQLQQQQTAATPQQVFELYSTLVQGGKVEAANGVMQKHGLANGTLIYGRPDLADVIFQELLAL